MKAHQSYSCLGLFYWQSKQFFSL
uniref:Uncharacterized protein n=1 Tax=Rhizophora mucronata TaxID=61149 RepID=A0A2P2IRQ3_RHIMU